MVVSRTNQLPLPPGNIPGTHFSSRLNRPRGHGAAGRIMSMKSSNDTIGNQTHNLPACSAMPQPTAPMCAPVWYIYIPQFDKIPGNQINSRDRQNKRNFSYLWLFYIEAQLTYQYLTYTIHQHLSCVTVKG